jgi:hypothetical protein
VMLGIVMMPSWSNAYRIQARTQTSKHNIVSLTIRESAQATDEIEFPTRRLDTQCNYIFCFAACLRK